MSSKEQRPRARVKACGLGNSVPGRLVPADELDGAGVPIDEADYAEAAELFRESWLAPVDEAMRAVVAEAEPFDDEPAPWDPVAELEATQICSLVEATQEEAELADLDVDLTLAAAVANQATIILAQGRQLGIAAHLADLHNAEAMTPPGGYPQGSARAAHGERLIARGGVGSPGFAEFAPAALAAVLRMSPAAATSLMVDALDVRHRLPRLCERVQAGEARAYLARQVAVATRDLSVEAAGKVDAKLAPVADTVTTGRFTTVLKAAVAAADPTRAETEAAEAGRRRGVWVDPDIDHGLATLFARANAADLAALSRALDVIARALKTLGDTDDPDSRRAKAVGILAHPQAALDLVSQAEAARAAASAAAAARRAGRPDPDLEDKTDKLRRFSFGPAVLYVHLSDQTLSGCAGDSTDRERDAGDDPGNAADADAEKAADVEAAGAGLVRVEGIGAVTAGQVRDWLTHRDVVVKPVIDLPNLPGIDGYEIPGWLTEAVHLRTPTDCSPYASNQTRRKDIDHTTAYRHPDHDTGSDGGGSDGGGSGGGGSGGGGSGGGGSGGGGSGGGSPPDGDQPPGQTRLDNLGPLTRANHRRKTFSDWQVTQPRSGVFVWRDPTGRHYLVDGNGTTPLGKLWSG